MINVLITFITLVKRKDREMSHLSPAERLRKKIAASDCSYIQVSDIPENQQLTIGDVRALAAEMNDHIRRNDAARLASEISAKDSFV